MNSKDTIFQKNSNEEFKFNEEVASVFDDMLSRSIPFYKECIDLITDLIIKNTKENDTVLDLGCSSANTLLHIFNNSTHKLNLIGVDNSKAMLKNAQNKIDAYKADIKLIQKDFINLDFPPSKIIIANYTMQFIPPKDRKILIQKIYQNLQKDGIFIMSEKIIYKNKTLNDQITDIYHQFKKQNGYSNLEIARKKEALENVLVPLTPEENIDLLKSAGFKTTQSIFKYANFETFVGMK